MVPESPGRKLEASDASASSWNQNLDPDLEVEKSVFLKMDEALIDDSCDDWTWNGSQRQYFGGEIGVPSGRVNKPQHAP